MWTKILDNKPKQGEMLEITLNGQDLFVANVEGELFCGENRCPHEDIKLTLGCLKDKTIRCSLHGFIFDLEDGQASEANIDNLTVYSVKEDNNKIYINL